MPNPTKCNPNLLVPIQKIVVFQQSQSGEKKIAGIREYGGGRFDLKCIDVEADLPAVIDDASEYLPLDFEADLVLDFLRHPDLSYDLARTCRRRGKPVVASGKKVHEEGALTPPT